MSKERFHVNGSKETYDIDEISTWIAMKAILASVPDILKGKQKT